MENNEWSKSYKAVVELAALISNQGSDRDLPREVRDLLVRAMASAVARMEDSAGVTAPSSPVNLKPPWAAR